MHFSSIAAFITCAALTAAGPMPSHVKRQGSDIGQGPYALYISQSQNPEYANKFLSPFHVGAAMDAAAVSDQPSQIFYIQNGQLVYYFQTGEGQTYKSAGGFYSQQRPGQHLQPLYLTPNGDGGDGSGTNPPPPPPPPSSPSATLAPPAGPPSATPAPLPTGPPPPPPSHFRRQVPGTNGTDSVTADNTFVADNNAQLTVRGSANKWYVCSDTQGAPGTAQTLTGLNLLVDGEEPADSNCAQVTVEVVTTPGQPGSPPPPSQ